MFNIQNLLIIMLLVVLIYRQLSVHEVQNKTRTYIILIFLGFYISYQHRENIDLSLIVLTLVIMGDIAVPVLFGWLRAKHTNIWINPEGLVVRQGKWVTLILWILYILIRGSISYFFPGNANFILISLGFSLLVQQKIIWHNASIQFSEQLKNRNRFKNN